ncbi:hypothetical protein GCM10011452_38180 [Gemmobacter lanyuensis]|uniref:Uncharacterized protein n=1 Tax=Gemmobacter lanyuensis TaxID=1054497 RepID=A0A918J4F4_9RHOB|nr:hypothetical protein GCM10011452_38180 [Gemmobacter lanyuensis]
MELQALNGLGFPLTVQTLIPKIASGGFRFHPALPHVRTSCIRCHMTNHDYIVVAKTKTGR